MNLAITIAILAFGYFYISAWRDYINHNNGKDKEDKK